MSDNMKLEEFFGFIETASEVKLEPDYVQLPLPKGPLNCPYCLHEGRINEFLVPKGKDRIGFLKKTVQCPNCKNIMRRNTLIQNSIGSLEEYANWLFWTGKYDADHRVKWKEIMHVLSERGIGKEFWDIYRKVKADYWAKRGSLLPSTTGNYSQDLT